MTQPLPGLGQDHHVIGYPDVLACLLFVGQLFSAAARRVRAGPGVRSSRALMEGGGAWTPALKRAAPSPGAVGAAAAAEESVLSAARTPPTTTGQALELHGPFQVEGAGATGELARERAARVSAEACVKVLMHDVMLLRGQAAHAEQRSARADHDWRAAVLALEVRLADRGFEGFGHERSAMAAEIAALKAAHAAQDGDAQRLRNDLDELQRKFDACSADLSRERRNARRLAAIAAERETQREAQARLGDAAGPSPGDSAAGAGPHPAHREEEAEELRRENDRLKACIRSLDAAEQARQQADVPLPAYQSLLDSRADQIHALEREIGVLKDSVRQRSSAEAARADEQQLKAAASEARVAELREEVAVLEEALRQQSRRSVQVHKDSEVSEMKVTALEHALAEAMRGRQDLENTATALTLQVAAAGGGSPDDRAFGAQLCSVATELESVAGVMSALQSHVSDLVRANAELEKRVSLATHSASVSSQHNSQRQQLWENMQKRLEANLQDKIDEVSRLQHALTCARQDSSTQATEIQNLRLQVKGLDEQLAAAGKLVEQVAAMKAAQARVDTIVDDMMDAVGVLDAQVGGKLHSACMQTLVRAEEAERLAQNQGVSKTQLDWYVDELQASVLGAENIVAQLVDASIGTSSDRHQQAQAMERVLSEHDAILDGISHLMIQISKQAQQHTVEKSAIESLRRMLADAHCQVVQTVASRATDQQTIAELEGKLQDAMTVVEAATEFKSGLAEQVQRIESSREADRQKIQHHAKQIVALEARIRFLEAENKALHDSASVEDAALRRLLTTIYTVEQVLSTAMTRSASATTSIQSKMATLAAECIQQEARAVKHTNALHRLQEQHELLLTELQGREKFILMMEEQQLSLHAQMLRLEDENRELSFAVQGHSIVQEIEHSHLEQAISKANAAAQVFVEAKSQRQRFEQHYTLCASHASDTQDQIARMETTLSQMAAALDQTLVKSLAETSRRRAPPLFVPTTQSGAQLAIVMAKNVCFLIENAGVPLLARGAAVAEELVIFFSEHFDSWMQEILSLSHGQHESTAVVNDLRSQLFAAQNRILGKCATIALACFLPADQLTWPDSHNGRTRGPGQEAGA